MATPSSSARWRGPIIIAGGCVLLACGIVVAAAAGYWFLRPRAQAGTPPWSTS